MVYCTKCGTQNDEDAAFCKSCGDPLGSAAAIDQRRKEREYDDHCEEDCGPGRGPYAWIWGALVLLIGLWIVFEFGVKNIEGLPGWLDDITFWWVFPIIVGVAIVILGLNIIYKGSRQNR